MINREICSALPAKELKGSPWVVDHKDRGVADKSLGKGNKTETIRRRRHTVRIRPKKGK